MDFHHGIERMWRDVYENVLDLFYQLFISFKNQGALNPDAEIHLYALHRILLPQIQRSLNTFRDAWNFHGLKTENNQSPLNSGQDTESKAPWRILQRTVAFSAAPCFPVSCPHFMTSPKSHSSM
ncbi:hypothetical protein CRENBAI_018735, partial [Crenichthys baileyi]